MKQTAVKLIHFLTADILLFLVILLTFCYFHHVRVLWGSGGPQVTPELIISRPSATPGTPSVTATPSREPVSGPDNTQAATVAPGPTDVPSPTAEPTPTPECDENGIPYDFSGDFGEKFGKLFSADNTIVKTSDTYRSHDVYIKITHFDGTLKQRRNQKSSAFNEDPVVYHLFDIYVRNLENLYTTYSANSRKNFMSLFSDNTNGDTIAAISGDFFFGYEASKEVVVRNGNVIRMSDYITDSICVLYWNGEMACYTHETYNKESIIAGSPYQIWCFGPILTDENGNAVKNTSSPIWIKNPRSAVGYVEPGHYVFLAVAGYRDEKQIPENGLGVTLETLAEIMTEHGCVLAYNLDGGASVYAGYDNEKLVEVHNTNGSKRPICDIICIGELRQNN